MKRSRSEDGLSQMPWLSTIPSHVLDFQRRTKARGISVVRFKEQNRPVYRFISCFERRIHAK
jgi:hypothetical protein